MRFFMKLCVSSFILVAFFMNLFFLATAFAEINNIEIREFISTERALGRTPDVKKRFGSDLMAINLSALDLSHIDFNNAKLGHVNFDGAKLYKTDLSGAWLCGATFANADLREAILTKASINFCSFKDADLRGTQGFAVIPEKHALTEVEAQGANFSGTDLKNSTFKRFKLKGADLSGVDLRGAVVAHTDFREAILRDVKVENTVFLNAILSDEQKIYLRKKGVNGRLKLSHFRS